MIVDDYVDPVVLTGFVREVPSPSNLMLNSVLPDRNIGDIEAAFDQVTRTNRAAMFRSWDTETPIGQRDSFQRSKVRMPPLGIKRPIGEQERLMLERARTGGDNRNGYVQAIYDDAALGAREVYNRMEIARGDTLLDGKFTIAENGLTVEADFGLDPSHIVSAATAWSDHANATPLTDLKAWVDLYLNETGERPGRILTSTRVVNNLMLAAEIRELFYRGDQISGGPNLVTPAQMSTVLQAHGLPAFETYDTKIDINGTGTRVIPDDKMLLLPTDPSSLGFTAWGVTAESLELAGGQNPGLLFEELPGLVGVVLKEGDPLRIWTKVGAVGMPLISDPRRLVVADVL